MASEVIIPVSHRGNILTPMETATRVPLPIWGPGEGKTNQHHAHFYKKDFSEGSKGSPNRAVRFSRLQRLRVSTHTQAHQELDGTLVPQSLEESYGVTIFNCARYLPGFVIDMSCRDLAMEDRIKEMTPAMRQELQRPGIFTIERRRGYRDEIGQFLMNYAIWQEFSEDDESHIQEFLSIMPEDALVDSELSERRLRLGMRLIGKGIEYAVDPINPEYRRARNEAALPEASPVCAWWVVKNYVQGHEPMYFDELTRSLQTQFAEVA